VKYRNGVDHARNNCANQDHQQNKTQWTRGAGRSNYQHAF
jgi:hypothetical protein